MKKVIRLGLLTLIFLLVLLIFIQSIRVIATPDARQIEFDLKSLEYEPSREIEVPQISENWPFDSCDQRIIDLGAGYLLLNSYDEYDVTLDFITYDKGLMHSSRFFYKKGSLWPREKSLWPVEILNNRIKEVLIDYEPGDSKINIIFKVGNIHWILLTLLFILCIVIMIATALPGLVLIDEISNDIGKVKLKWILKGKGKK
jgi:hypothetical protein